MSLIRLKTKTERMPTMINMTITLINYLSWITSLQHKIRNSPQYLTNPLSF